MNYRESNIMDKILNNFFILDDRTVKVHPIVRLINKTFRKLLIHYKLVRTINPAIDMNTVEQRMNFFHLITSVIDRNVDGEFVELGSFIGHCAVLFQEILDMHHSNKELHLYDSFEEKFTVLNDIEEELRNNFKKNNLKTPFIHRGFFKDTLPQELPDKISFAHIDCGWGGSSDLHKQIVLFCLENTYGRLTKGAICVLMDYYNSALPDGKSEDYNPGVKLACDEFFKDKAEKIICLYGNKIPHAYFKKE